MAVSRMRHHNSPEERAKRAGEPEAGARKGKEFRHYNHPDEVAKRAAAGNVAAAPVAVPRRVVEASGVGVPPQPWTPPGTVDNTEPVSQALSVPAAAPTPEPEPEQSTERMTAVQRLRALERLVWSFFESEEEAREFRMLLNNQAAVTEVQQGINNRVRTLEQRLDAADAEAEAALTDDDDDEADDDGEALEPESPTAPDAAPKPTTTGGAT